MIVADEKGACIAYLPIWGEAWRQTDLTRLFSLLVLLLIIIIVNNPKVGDFRYFKTVTQVLL